MELTYIDHESRRTIPIRGGLAWHKDIDGNHIAAAQKLAAKLWWYGKWVQGCLHNGDYVHTRVAEWTEYVVAEQGTNERGES